MAGKTYLERRGFRNQLKTYLDAHGWAATAASTVTYKEGFKSEDTIKIPTVAITFLRSNIKQLQMGNMADRTFKRIIQVDCYMESEARAIDISDAIMEFMDIEPIVILDPSSTTLGSLISETDTLYADVLPPKLNDPRILNWRAVIRGTYEAFYAG
jgi:hypothetical protein